MALNMTSIIYGIKIAIFLPQNHKNHLAAGGSPQRPPQGYA